MGANRRRDRSQNVKEDNLEKEVTYLHEKWLADKTWLAANQTREDEGAEESFLDGMKSTYRHLEMRESKQQATGKQFIVAGNKLCGRQIRKDLRAYIQ